MPKASLTLSDSRVPEKWKKKYILKRIDEEDIIITLEERNIILAALSNNVRFVQIGEFTLMVNAIKSVEPFWGGNNIPPRPKVYSFGGMGDGKYEKEQEAEQREWDIYFGKKKEALNAT